MRAVGLRLGNRSWHSTLDQAGAQNSQSPVDANAGTVMELSCSSGFRRLRSLLLTSGKLMIGQLGRPTPGLSLFRSFSVQVLRAILIVRRQLPLHRDKQIYRAGRHFAFVPATDSMHHSVEEPSSLFRARRNLVRGRSFAICSRYHQRRLAMELILIVVVLVLLFGGGGYYGRRRGHW